MPDDETVRVALVTGGAGSLGSCIGARLLADGAIVVLADLDRSRAERVATELGARGRGLVLGMATDVADESSSHALVEAIIDRFGRLDVLVNNAGVNRRNSLADLRVDDWDATMAINLRGAAVLCSAALPHWQRQRWGRVVNMGSRTWLSGGPIAYVTSKAGLVGMTRALARELGPWGVTVNLVAPGMVDTPLTRSSRDGGSFESVAAAYRHRTPLGRLATPDDIAHAVSFLASAGAGFITGEVLNVSGGMQMAPAP